MSLAFILLAYPALILFTFSLLRLLTLDLSTSTTSHFFLLLSEMITLGLISRDAVVRLVEAMTSGWGLEILNEIGLLVDLELAAVLCSMLALARLIVDSSDSSSLLLIDSIFISETFE